MQAYIFDLDGTLFDSMGVWLDIDAAFFKKRGIASSPDYFNIVSAMTLPEAAVHTKSKYNLPESPQEILKEWFEMALHAYENTVQMKPFAKEYLAKLKQNGAKLAIATSSPPELYKPLLKRFEIYDWFETICNANDVGCGKSRPDIFLLVAKKLNVKPTECIVFEDILEAVISAKSIGMTVYAIYDKSSAKDWLQIQKTADAAFTSWQSVIM